ncbi:cold-shock protein [Nocardioides sp.]|uniref:cold-shock protein n=1 Tax=Nocardioides sp. TaxID=35761 RepID=UPI002609829A|nr:cold shock domain-containing protein [Nocardioides sp.]
MPTGKVKWFDAEKGFGFLSQEGGEDVYVHADALPAGVAKTLKPGTRVEFGIAQGRRGEQALQVRILDAPASVSRNVAAAKRRKPEEMELIVENVITLLEDIREGYRHGRGPTRDLGKKVSPALRALADEFEL